MALTVLNNISSLVAENALSNTQMNLQTTLTQLATGLRINSGSEDAAGLSIANGMGANIAALTQSQQNASNGVGLLQTADGALSQVSSLLNRAVTLATEASTGGFSGSQAEALDNEFQSILTEINQIGSATNFNGTNVFAGNTGTAFSTTAGTEANALTTASTLATGSVTTVSETTSTGAVFTSTYTNTGTTGADTIADLDTYLEQSTSLGGLGLTSAEVFAAGTAVQGSVAADGADTNNLEFTGDGTSTYTITTSDNTALKSLNAYAGASNDNFVFISDASTPDIPSDTEITTAINALSSTTLGLSNATSGANDSLLTTASAQTALTDIYNAITSVSAQRGAIGASVNRLNAVVNVMSNQVQNIQSAQNNIQNADIGKTVANMTQYNILESTGMAALQQSNQAQQAVLKLVQ
jgi:flagellin